MYTWSVNTVQHVHTTLIYIYIFILDIYHHIPIIWKHDIEYHYYQHFYVGRFPDIVITRMSTLTILRFEFNYFIDSGLGGCLGPTWSCIAFTGAMKQLDSKSRIVNVELRNSNIGEPSDVKMRVITIFNIMSPYYMNIIMTCLYMLVTRCVYLATYRNKIWAHLSCT